MKRIIQRYQDGGGVNPMVSTGVPEGGYAKQAIANYLAGETLGGPLSYVAGESNVPDYHALADELGTSVIDGYRPATAASAAAAAGDNNTAHEEMMAGASNNSVANNTYSTGSGGDTSSWVTDQETYGAPGGYWGGSSEYESNLINNPYIGDEEFWDTYESGEASGSTFSGGGRDGAGNYGIAGDVGAAIYDAAGNLLNGSLIGRGYTALTGNNLLDPYDATKYPDGVVPNEYNPDGTPKTTGLNLTGPVNPNLSLKRGGRYDTSVPDATANDSIAKDEASRGAFGNQIWSPALGRHLNPSQVANRRANGLPVNNGGFIGPLVKGYNNGGVSLAKSGIREEEIQERQRMQARLPQVQKDPLSDIGSQLAMGAIDKGIGSAASSLAGQGGLAGTLGTALGGTAGAAGSGMMAALGPIGIGIGLGKLFGVFNKGGKVTCSCGKPNCNCSSKMKYSPLGGSYD